MTAAYAYLFKEVSGLLINRRKTMLQFFQKLFCFHAFDYESDIFAEVECRKCGKTKPE